MQAGVFGESSRAPLSRVLAEHTLGPTQAAYDGCSQTSGRQARPLAAHAVPHYWRA